ncbi:helix-turn-helix domain-containing protein [Rhodoblastus acidophilus]|uniref:helix-turn-helix domain-containing protein n=1 Tax=Rhodoblastus acidophilus TaxID=1074 RepID=UPI003CD0057A
MNQLLTLQEAAERLRICERSLRAFVDAGEIAYIDLARPHSKRRRMVFDPADLEAFATERRRKACPSSSGKTPRISGMNSAFKALDFAALRASRAAERQKLPSESAKPKPRGR